MAEESLRRPRLHEVVDRARSQGMSFECLQHVGLRQRQSTPHAGEERIVTIRTLNQDDEAQRRSRSAESSYVTL